MAKDYTDAGKVIIFFDIDGVLGDFDAHAERHGKRAANGKVDYNALDEGWWASMPVCAHAQDVVKAARERALVRFLTAPVADHACFSGKARWVREQFQPEKGRFGLMDLMICPAKDKALLAGPRRILIDDNADNVAAWNGAGGVGILHEGDFSKTWPALAQALARFDGPVLRPRPPGPVFG